jgi:Uma2 family endonuclease
MSTIQSLVTAEEFVRMSFDVPVELVRGEIVDMPPADQAHGCVCGNVFFAISAWARQSKTGLTTANDSGVITERDPDTVRGTGVCYFSNDRIPGGKFDRRTIDLVPNVCVEVLSESDRWRYVHRKIDEYLERGVNEVWAVDPRKRHVQVFRADEPPVTFAESSELTSEQLPGFRCPVAELFVGV